MVNALYFGDDIDILRTHVKRESVDLVHLDPPLYQDRFSRYSVIIACAGLMAHAPSSRQTATDALAA